jgi:hypothetical protein
VVNGVAEPASYKQSIPPIGLSLERHTKAVPGDGYYYVLLKGEIKGRFRNKNAALELYREVLKTIDYTPPPVEKITPRNEAVEGYLDATESYWGDSHKHTRRGGKGGY